MEARKQWVTEKWKLTKCSCRREFCPKYSTKGITFWAVLASWIENRTVWDFLWIIEVDIVCAKQTQIKVGSCVRLQFELYPSWSNREYSSCSVPRKKANGYWKEKTSILSHLLMIQRPSKIKKLQLGINLHFYWCVVPLGGGCSDKNLGSLLHIAIFC